jgi:phosphinothricin acetyltransferase
MKNKEETPNHKALNINASGEVREVRKEDIQQICDIYNFYVKNTSITFEEDPVSSREMEERIKDVTASFPWYVYLDHGKLIGYAYASKWRGRCAYRYTVESTIYLKNDLVGKGIGSFLYAALLDDLRKRGVHAVLGAIALPNERSQRLHENLGFEIVARFKEVGSKFGKWVDVEFWELLLNKQ